MRVHFFSNTDFTTYRYHINTWESLLLVLKDYEKQGQSKLNVKSIYILTIRVISESSGKKLV